VPAEGARFDLTLPVPLTPLRVGPSDFSGGLVTLSVTGPGTIMFKYLIQEDGSVSDGKVISRLGARALGDLAIAVAKTRWKFTPAMKDGKPVRFWNYGIISFGYSDGTTYVPTPICADEIEAGIFQGD